MEVILNEQSIEFTKDRNIVTIIIGRTPYNEHDVDISITLNEFQALLTEMEKLIKE